ncbi:MAG: acyl-CoA dehydrogenase family protein [bacterium]
MKTHDVQNQVPPLLDFDAWASDPALREAVAREGAAWAQDELAAFGKLTGSAALHEHARLANENRPKLRAFDARGHRINAVEFHPSYHALMQTSLGAGLAGRPWTDDRKGALVARLAGSHLMGRTEQGHGCPVTMTFAAVPALRHAPALADRYEHKITAPAYDPRNVPAADKSALTVGMAMTEKQGGSDVRANTTRATEQPDGSHRLTGHKWFCSAPMCDLFLTLAHEDAGLSCFLVPRFTPDGAPNAMNLQRLKDKVGNHSNASSEIEYDGAFAERVGEPGRGVRTIIDMVAHTRLDCVNGSAALMREALGHAVHHATHRRAFGRRLVEHPLMQNVLADLTLEAEAATALALRLGRAYEEGRTDDGARAFARIATAIGKYHVCKRTPAMVYEALECHGGNGFVEEHPLARLYREAPLNSIWEGSGNVICLDVLRALAREPETLPALRAELTAARGADRRYDAWIGAIEAELRDVATLEFRARRLVERLAVALQAAILIRGARPEIADAFVASRLVERGHREYGTLADQTAVALLIERADPLAH